MRIIAHRGASAETPENTFSAFDRALLRGVFEIELDVRLSQDGITYVIHDAALDRTTSGSGLLRNSSSSRIDQLDAGAWWSPEFAGEPVPRLEQVLDLYRGVATLHIELKDDCESLADAVCELLVRAGLESQCWITSFYSRVLARVRSAISNARLGYIARKKCLPELKLLSDLNVEMVCPHVDDVNSEVVDRFVAHGFLVRVWGLRSQYEKMQRICMLPVYGFTCDDLAAAKKCIEEHGS